MLIARSGAVVRRSCSERREFVQVLVDQQDRQAQSLQAFKAKPDLFPDDRIPIPLSAVLARCLKLARAYAEDTGLIFPGLERGNRDKLPARGHAMRRTFKSIAFDCNIPDDMSAFILGHVPVGMSAKYALRRVLLKGRALRKYQRTVSRRVLELLGADPTLAFTVKINSLIPQDTVGPTKVENCREMLRAG